MKFFKLFFFLLALLFLFNCNPASKIQTIGQRPPLQYNESVKVLSTTSQLPDGATKIGIVQIGDSGFSTNCGLEKVLDDAKMEARKMGGNLLLITRHKTPDFWSTCHRITADVFYYNSTE